MKDLDLHNPDLNKFYLIMTNLRALLLVIYLCTMYSQLMAQDATDDQYSDYSYLWEDSKKKNSKKKKNRSSDTEKKVSTPTLDSLAEKESINTFQNDTLKQEDSQNFEEEEIDPIKITNTYDSLNQENIEPSYSDSLDVDELEEPKVAADSLQEDQSVDPNLILEDASNEEPKSEDLAKEKKKEKYPIEDFRSPMSAGGGSSGSFNGGFTLTLIDDQYYAGLTLQPEFSIGKVGIGLNVPILYGLEDQKVRTEMFKDGVGVARLITYVRYGVQKRDPVYVKLGQLNNTMIGFGGLVNNYTNTTSFEKRKVGLHYDVNYRGLAGIEGMYSDFNASSFNLFVMRPYVRPFSQMPIPIVKTTEFGMTFIRDSDQTDIAGSQYAFTQDGIGAFGLDMGMTLLRVPFIQIDFFANYSRLNVASKQLTDSLTIIYNEETPEALADGFKNGSGASIGFNFRFHFIANILSTDVRIERLNYSEHYLPQFFNTTYELNKDARILALAGSNKMAGIYGSLQGHILQKITLGGSLMIPDEISKESPAFVEVNANLERLADKITIQGSYFKGNLEALNDAFTFDENSLAKVRAMYHLNKWMAAGMDYYWAFTPTENGGFEATKYVSPYFGLSITF